MEDIVRIHLKGFRAIKDADIKLNGITLVSGVNGCGKSTISKFLYHSLDEALRYNEIAKEEAYTMPLRPLFDAIMEVYGELKRLYIQKGLGQSASDEANERLMRGTLWFLTPSEHQEYLREIEEYYQALVDAGETVGDVYIIRLARLFRDALGKIEIVASEVKDGLDLSAYIAIAKRAVEQSDLNIYQLEIERPSELWIRRVLNAFLSHELPEKYQLFEHGASVLDFSESSIQRPHTLNKLVYYDTPVFLGLPTYSLPLERTKSGKSLEELLANPVRSMTDDEIRLFILMSQEIRGEAFLKEKRTWGAQYVFKQGEQEFRLTDVATGIKAFSILQLLLKNGHLDDRTLLIIDEPEAHLHPQWVVEYARMVVLLNKHLGVKFFLASHNPDFVSALKYIAEKEGVGERTNFYLAEEDENEPNQFNYRSLGLDIDPIFKSFNIALDRISLYGATE